MFRSKRSRNSDSRHRAYSWAISGFLALALAILLGQQAYAHAQQASDVAAIEQVVLKAAGASLQAVVVPNTRADYTASAGALAASQADLSAAQAQAHALFNSVYAPACVPCQTQASKTYETLQAQEKGTFRALAWKVSDVDWRQVMLDGQTASVTVSMTLWSKVQYVDEYGKLNTVTPIGGEVMIYSLDQFGGNWLITNQVSDSVAASNLPINQQKPSGQTGDPPAGQPTPVKINPTAAPKK
jgi:hypothetical protein